MVKLGRLSGFTFFSLFYLVTGIALLTAPIQSSPAPFHVLMLGALSLIASYGLSKMKRWTLYVTVLICLSGATFGCTTIYAIFRTFSLGLGETLLLAATTLYVAILAIASFYLVRKRDKFA